jgi:universal stress protein A
MAIDCQTILAPIQFNDPNCIAALEVARKLAFENQGRIFLLHVIPPNLVIPDLPGYRDLFPKDENAVREELSKMAALHLPRVQYETIAATGDAAETICLKAKELKASIIVLSTHGRLGISHFLLGSVAEKVIRQAPCIVLTMRPKFEQS